MAVQDTGLCVYKARSVVANTHQLALDPRYTTSGVMEITEIIATVFRYAVRCIVLWMHVIPVQRSVWVDYTGRGILHTIISMIFFGGPTSHIRKTTFHFSATLITLITRKATKKR